LLQKLTNVLMFKYRALRNFVSRDIALLVHAFIVYVIVQMLNITRLSGLRRMLKKLNEYREGSPSGYQD